jgi:hypothetical protein
VTTPGTTDDVAAEGSDADTALAAGLEALAVLHDGAMTVIAQLAETWAVPDGDHRVLRMTGRPTLAAPGEVAAA